MLQVDAVLSRANNLKERIDATESLIMLDLDHRRNEIVGFNLVARCKTPLAQKKSQIDMLILSRCGGNASECMFCAMQLITIVTMCIAFVSMIASIFGQNLYFNVAETPIVSPSLPCHLSATFISECYQHVTNVKLTSRTEEVFCNVGQWLWHTMTWSSVSVGTTILCGLLVYSQRKGLLFAPLISA